MPHDVPPIDNLIGSSVKIGGWSGLHKKVVQGSARRSAGVNFQVWWRTVRVHT